jgi:hypothetical protein
MLFPEPVFTSEDEVWAESCDFEISCEVRNTIVKYWAKVSRGGLELNDSSEDYQLYVEAF